ncbi:MAG: type II secretion system protein [Verrucomicrobia bacterium]|nr:type II secretion system protein [Verrucomicrobiota bacterium]
MNSECPVDREVGSAGRRPPRMALDFGGARPACLRRTRQAPRSQPERTSRGLRAGTARAPTKRPRRASPFGFTLVELLVVIAMVGVLASLLLPALSAAKGRAHATRCLSNLKQFAVALQLYGQDHEDRLPPNADGREEALGGKWVEGWLGLPGPDCTNTLYLERSLLAPYLGGEVGVWRCPAARPVTVGTVTQPRVRTVSLNCFLGSPVESPVARTYRRLGEIAQPSPAEALTFVEERVETINDGSFALQWDFRLEEPAGWVLRDKPGVLHRGGAHLSFADGHVELHRWQDARTVSPPRDDAVMPGNADIQWLQERSTWRER